VDERLMGIVTVGGGTGWGLDVFVVKGLLEGCVW